MKPINYRKSGSGFPVLLLHGFCENLIVWDDLNEKLSQDYLVIAPDLPGFGQSELFSSLSIDTVAEDISQWLRNLGINSCVVVGHSLGGYISLALADKHPGIVSGLVLFNSTPFPDSPEKKDSRNKTIEFIRNNGISAFAQGFVPNLFYAERKKELSVEIEVVTAMVKSTSQDTAIAYTKAMRDRPDRSELLAKLNYHSLVLAGDNDSIIPVNISTQIADLSPRVHLELLSNCGHMGMYENPRQSYQAISRYLMEVVS